MNEITKMPIADDAKKALSRMLNGFNWSGDENEKKLKLDAYWDVLGGLPPNVVVAACAAAARGELGDERRFPPTAAKVYERAVSYLPKPPSTPLEPARIIPADEREGVTAAYAALARELAEKNAQQEPERTPAARWPLRSLSELIPAALMPQLSKEALERITK